MGEDVR